VRILLAALWMATWLSAAPAWAGQEFQPPSPDELKMTSEPLATGAPAIILERRVDRDDNRPTHEDNYLRIKVLSEEGRKYADVEFAFYPGISDVRNIRARTIRPDGSITDFDGNIYEKYVVKARGLKVLTKTFTFPDVRVGSILEYSYIVDLKGYLYDSHWILNGDLFTKRAQFSLRPYQASYIPMSLRQTSKDVPSGAEPKEGPDHVIRMEVTNIPAFQAEDSMPPENELKSRVDFIYEQYFVEPDPDKFWKNIGRWRNDALEAFLRKHKAVEEAVRGIVLPTDTPEEKLRKIYARVLALRNTSYEIEKTEKEEKRNKEKLATSVDEVWKHGYGDAVELTWLFLGLVRAAGFEAYGCWVADRSEYFFNPKLMDSAGLRANVVLVKLNGKDIFLDPGIVFAPFGLLPWNETATPGIRLDNNGGTWIRTPLPDSAQSETQFNANFKLSESGNLEGTLTATYSGLEAMYRRMVVRNIDEIGRKDYLEELVKRRIPAPAEVQLARKPDWSNPELPLVATFAVKIPNWASSTGRRVLFPAGIFAAQERHAFESADRIHPIYFDYPYRSLDDLAIELPREWQTIAVPQPRTQKGNSIVYSMKIEDQQKIVRITRQLDVDIFILEPAAYPGLRRFFQLIRSSDEDQIVLQPPGPHAGLPLANAMNKIQSIH
jgi:Domain of Unknown Function with PDB structure (DUF3857)